ncbi:MAG: hypothetical protein AAGH67_19230, partial [Cyanobacteria bacterium P01_H01_bin.162]
MDSPTAPVRQFPLGQDAAGLKFSGSCFGSWEIAKPSATPTPQNLRAAMNPHSSAYKIEPHRQFGPLLF